MAVDLGDVVPLSVRVYDSAGDLADATAVDLTVTLPDGTADVIGTIPSTSTGVYEYEYATTEVGRHVVRWVASGVNASSFVDVFNVQPADPGFLIGIEELKQHLNLTDEDVATEGEELRRFLASASQTVENLIGPVSRRTVVETHYGACGPLLVLRQRPVLSVTSMSDVYGSTYVSTDWDLNSDTGILRVAYAGSFSQWSGDVTVTYVAGRESVPSDVQEAVAELVRDSRSASQAGGGGRAFGQPEGEAAFTAGRPAVPPYVLSKLEPYLLGPSVA